VRFEIRKLIALPSAESYYGWHFKKKPRAFWNQKIDRSPFSKL